MNGLFFMFNKMLSDIDQNDLELLTSIYSDKQQMELIANNSFHI